MHVRTIAAGTARAAALASMTLLLACDTDQACDTSNPLMPVCPEAREELDGPRPLVVFASSREGGTEIFTMNSDGTGARRLTVNAGTDHMPAWSPDGTRIVWASVRSGSPSRELWLMNADGSDQRQLTSLGTSPGWPHWSPDGSRIAFHAARGGGDWDIYTIAADGTDLRRLTTMNSHLRPRWSPDGSRIAFSWYQTTGPGACCSRIGIMNADGSGLRILATGSMQDSEPDWSPDGRQLAFGITLPMALSQIGIINEDGTGLRTLGSATYTAAQVSWSRSTGRIHFTTFQHGAQNIHSIHADGSGLRRLTAVIGSINSTAHAR
jgi:Tol biopolymer transport system component